MFLYSPTLLNATPEVKGLAASHYAAEIVAYYYCQETEAEH